ncbi:MAG: hypothetical protein HY902_16295 [Deltaproteobacteria bacterium]|nr:hypothetical protein [Deltaproteobacteria bacterium]
MRTSAPPERKDVKRVHAAARADREALEAELRSFLNAYREAAAALREQAALLAAGQSARLVQFPPWSFPPAAPGWPLLPGSGEKML